MSSGLGQKKSRKITYYGLIVDQGRKQAAHWSPTHSSRVLKACYWVSSNKAGLLARDILADRLAQNVDSFRTSVNDQRLRHFVKERKKRSHSYSNQNELLWQRLYNYIFHHFRKANLCPSSNVEFGILSESPPPPPPRIKREIPVLISQVSHLIFNNFFYIQSELNMITATYILVQRSTLQDNYYLLYLYAYIPITKVIYYNWYKLSPANIKKRKYWISCNSS